MKKKWIYILVAAVVVLVVIGLIKGKTSGRSLEVSVEKAERRTIIETVAASGKIQPEIEVIISSDVSGEIIAMPVREGDQVKMGDLLVKIDPDLVASALSRVEAALNNSKANLEGTKARLEQSESQFENTRASFERSKKLYADKVISQAEFDQATANFQVAEAEVQASKKNVEAARFSVRSAEASLKEAQENLGRTSIYAPMDGVITKLNREKGERVVGTAQMAGTEIMTIADLSLMEVAVEVNENDIVRVHLNDTTEIEVDAYLGDNFKGIVTEIANSANISGMSADQVTNFDVKIRMLPFSYAHLQDSNRNSSPFRPGMSATVDIRTNVVRDALSVPIQSVTTRKDSVGSTQENKVEEEEESLQEVVFVHQEGLAKKTVVKTGIQDTRYIQILEGIEEGAEVVTSPYTLISKMLKDGDKLEVVDKKKLFSQKEKR
jgi:HlyD family secretion protein